ncbi:MAG: ABC transporter permease [Bacteroidetes bacterium]|nr:ABC transporter permease [Bacteroidota bacterium]MDA1125814.1 ABC transporter permease [Bacteroidota bacterium]
MINFSKIWLIIKREYKTRVQTKSFLLSTFLTPLLILGFMGFIIFMTVSDNEAPKQVIVIDETGRMLEPLTQLNATRYLPINADQSIEQIRELIMEDELDGYVFFDQTFLTEGTPAAFIHNGSGGITFFESLHSDVRDVTRQIRLEDNEVSDAIIAIFEERPALENRRLNEVGVDEQSNPILSFFYGILIGVFIFIGLFVYGTILMRSVIEEKTSRIVEIITSSVKPIELMLGKLLGVCLVALTQFSLWIATYAGVTILAAPVAQFFINQRMGDLQNSLNAVDAEGTAANVPSDIDLSFLEQFSIDPLFVLYFFVFFVLGFLMYSSIFAAIGAAVDSEQDSQQFQSIIFSPIFLGYMLNLRIAEAPDSTFAIVASLFPLTSPINMVTRMLVSNVPFWEVLLSILLLILSLIGMLLLAARIYRTGILMYGKKPTFKELYKWIRQA